MSDTRFAPDVDLDGLTADEAFATLGDETRLDIVRALWEADAKRTFDEGSTAARTISFSDLRRRVDVDDNGRFNYHLSKLRPHFVVGGEDGYRLSSAGKELARTVVAVSSPDRVDFAADLDQPCPLCGDALVASYAEGWLRVACTGCDGLFGDEAPRGTFVLTRHPPADVRERDPEGVLGACAYRCHLDLPYLMQGVCKECSGTVSGSVSVCEDHEVVGEGACPGCDTRFAAWGERRCETCGFAKRLPVALFAMGLTPVIAVLERAGVDVLDPTFEQTIDVLRSRVETSVAADSRRVRVTVAGDGESVTAVLDDALEVVAYERSGDGRRSVDG